MRHIPQRAWDQQGLTHHNNEMARIWQAINALSGTVDNQARAIGALQSPPGDVSVINDPSNLVDDSVDTQPPDINGPDAPLAVSATFVMPWKKRSLLPVRKKQSGNSTAGPYGPIVGKIWSVTGWYLHTAVPGQTEYLNFYRNGSVVMYLSASADGVSVSKSPSQTHGLFLSGRNADALGLTGNNASCNGWFRVEEFDEGSANVNTVVKQVYLGPPEHPYVIPPGRSFVLTYAFGTGNLTESNDGGLTYEPVLASLTAPGVLDPSFSIAIHGGVMEFSYGIQLLCDTPATSWTLFGYERPSS
jgi:hypothetical protein